MSYNPDNKIISAPVSIRDVQQCLGSSSNDLATLCMRPNINMWSPRKPIYSSKLYIASGSEDWDGRSHVLAGYKTGGGIKKAVVSGTDYLNSTGSGGVIPSAVWTHDAPILDGTCFFRLTDFSGYWHTAGRMFYIGTIFGNVNHIIIPSSDAEGGATVGFSMWFNVNTGQITARELFGDCWSTFYPGVIMCCGGDYKFNYVKTTSSPISAYVSSEASISFNTRDFMDQMKADWTAKGLSGSPYDKYPFRSGDNWTACLVLISREFTGGAGSNHKLSGSESIVRLEYASPSNDVYVDRRTLPMKTSKYNTIEWMKMVVTIQRQGIQSGNEIYKISSIVVTAKMLSSDSITFEIGAQLTTPQGTVNVQGVPDAGNIENYSHVTFSGTVGEVSKSLSYNETTYYVPQAATTGNKLCNGTLIFKNALGNFSGTFSIDISSQSYQYQREVNLL